jgi:hypothetical protein
MIAAKRVFVAVMGAWMGLAGVEHGVGELLQGNRAPAGVMIQSWPDSPFFRSLGGEPAMTILPNLFITGLLAIFFSLLFAAWAGFAAQRRRAGPILILFAAAMLLFGGGIFPPVLGLFIGLAATALRAQPDHTVLTGLGRMAGEQWAWIFTLNCLAWLALFPGIAVLDYFWGIDHPTLTLAIMLAAFALLFLSYWSSVQHDRLPRRVA